MNEIVDFVDEEAGSDSLFDCEYTSVDAIINQVVVFTGAKAQQTENGERCLIAYGEGYNRSAFFTDSKKLKDVVLAPNRQFPFRAIIKVVNYGTMMGFKFFPPTVEITDEDKGNFEAMTEVLTGTGYMLVIIVLACLIVLGAMIIDLGSGLYKAHQRNELKSSWGLKRTLSKFIMYEGGMLIAAGVDLLIFLSKLLVLFHLDLLQGVPIITCLVGIFLLIVEGMSVHEKADEKTKTEIARVAELSAKMVNKEELVEALTQAIVNANKKQE